MSRQCFNFGNQWALVGALATLAFFAAANIGFFIGRDIGRKPNSNQQESQQVRQERQTSGDVEDRML